MRDERVRLLVAQAELAPLLALRVLLELDLLELLGDPLAAHREQPLGAFHRQPVLDVVLPHELDGQPDVLVVGRGALLEQRREVGRIEAALLDERVREHLEHDLCFLVIAVLVDERAALGDPLVEVLGAHGLLALCLHATPLVERHRLAIVDLDRCCGCARGGIGARGGRNRGRRGGGASWLRPARQQEAGGERRCARRLRHRELPFGKG